MEKSSSFQKNSPEKTFIFESPQIMVESPAESSDDLIDKMQDLFAVEQNLLTILGSDNTREITPLVEEAKESEQTYFVMKNILERGRKETHFFDGLIETDIYQALIDGNLEAPKINGVKVAWQKKMEKFAGSFKHHKGVQIAEAPTSSLSIITALSISGDLPNGIKTLFHELIHATQFSYSESFKTLMKDTKEKTAKKYDHTPTELREAQAYRTADFPPRDSRHEDIIENMHGSYDTDPQKLEYAIEAIDRLQALGFSINEIGKLIVLPEKWDEQKKIYPAIEAAISQKITEQRTTEKDVPLLKQIYRLKQSIDSIKVALIAREELRKWKAEKEAKKQAQSPSI